MYFNTKYIKESGLFLHEIIMIQLIRQNRTENMEDVIALYWQDEYEEKLSQLITRVKKKKKTDSDFSVLRITKKGEEILENAQTPEITPGDLDMYNYLTSMYLEEDREERKIGNQKKVKSYIAIFRNHLSLSLHQMYWLCWLFLQEYKFTKVLEYLFFNSNKNRYGNFKNNIEDSPLYQFYTENRKRIEEFWKTKNCYGE